MPAVKPFLDTCVPVYALTHGDRRQERAIEILSGEGVISIQILNEFANVCQRKLQLDWQKTVRALSNLYLFCPDPIELTLSLHQNGIQIARRYGFSVYDGQMVAAALEARCTTLYTEDLQHGQIIEGLRIVNPFLAAGS